MPIKNCIKMGRAPQALRPDADEVGMARDTESSRVRAKAMCEGEGEGEGEGEPFRGHRNCRPYNTITNVDHQASGNDT